MGRLSRSEVIRGVDRSGNSGTWRHGSFIQASHLGLQFNQQSMQALPYAGGVMSQHSPNSSRDASPDCQKPSGPASLPDWHISSNPSYSDEVPCVVTAPLHGKLLDPSVLDLNPSFAYERGDKALWLDRHSSMNSSGRTSSQCKGDVKSPRYDDVVAPCNDCLAYGPTWAISQSLVWHLAEEYIRSHPAPPMPQPSESQQHDAADSRCGQGVPTNKIRGQTKCQIRCSESDSTPAIPASTRTPPGRTFAPSLSLPCGIGPVGLTSPARKRLKHMALLILARSRMELRRGWHEAQLEMHGDIHNHNHPGEEVRFETHKAAVQDAHTTPPASDAAASDPVPAAVCAPVPLASMASDLASSDAAPRLVKCSHGRPREPTMCHMLEEVAAEAIGSCPTSRQAVRRRVRMLVAGVSVAYTAANLGCSAAAVMHADFANDFTNSAKAVLDFLFTAPSLSGIVTDLVQIGVAVGIGMAQRRTPDL